MTPLLCRLPRNFRRGHLRNLHVTFDDGSEENVKVLPADSPKESALRLLPGKRRPFLTTTACLEQQFVMGATGT